MLFKDLYFQSAYPAPSTHPQLALILFWDSGDIQITYLITYLHWSRMCPWSCWGQWIEDEANGHWPTDDLYFYFYTLLCNKTYQQKILSKSTGLSQKKRAKLVTKRSPEWMPVAACHAVSWSNSISSTHKTFTISQAGQAFHQQQHYVLHGYTW